MEFLTEIFKNAANGALTLEEFKEGCKKANVKLANLSGGEYVSKAKYSDDIKAKDEQISTLTETIKTRDTDLENVKKQLEDAGADKEKLSTLSTDLSTLQTKYDTDTKAYEQKLNRQAYEFAVKDYANSKKFSSNAAKRDFINFMIGKNLTMENGSIMGADDFAKAYSVDNSDAFVAENPTPIKPVPQIISDETPAKLTNTITKEQFSKMGYKARTELYNSNRELYNELSK